MTVLRPLYPCMHVQSAGAQGQPALHNYHVVPQVFYRPCCGEGGKVRELFQDFPRLSGFALTLLNGICGLCAAANLL